MTDKEEIQRCIDSPAHFIENYTNCPKLSEQDKLFLDYYFNEYGIFRFRKYRTSYKLEFLWNTEHLLIRKND